MTGVGRLARLAARRDRLALPAWVVGIAALVVFAGASIKELYPDQADLADFAKTIGDNPALIAIRGRTYAIDTLGGAITWQLGYFLMLLAGLMSLLLVARHTRADEEVGRTELLLAGPVGRRAPTAAALIVVGLANVALAVLVAVGMLTLDLPVGGSLVLGASVGGVGLVFAAVAAVTAQLATTSRAASGLAGAVLGVAYVVRGIGDVAGNWISWLSPIGWAQQMRPFAGDRWWPLLLLLAAAAALVVVAWALLARRDYGAGVVSPGPGPARASRLLATPQGFALRLQRGTFYAWLAGLFLLGLAYGSLGQNIQDLLDTSQQAEDIFVQDKGVSVVDSFFATTSLTLALIGTAFTISSLGRLRSEETSGRAEPILATGLGRVRWASTHLAVSTIGTALLLAAAGAGTGLAYGISGAGLDEVPRLLAAGIAQAPAAWVLGGLTLLIFGLFPRAGVAAWVPLAFCFVVGTLGPLLGLPDWVDDLSPFAAQPGLPADPFDAMPLLGLTLLASALSAAGLVALRRRDIG